MSGDTRGTASEALRSVLDAFRTKDLVTLSRSDLRSLADEPDLAQFVMATIVWGYTSGGRGNNVKNLMCNLGDLTELLSEVRAQPITDWNYHYKKVKSIKGLGPSTYTKFLNFLSVKVHGDAALILDARIIRVLSQGVWKELDSLRALAQNPVSCYPTYLKQMHRIANNLEVSAEALECFLFEFGLSLKPPSGR